MRNNFVDTVINANNERDDIFVVVGDAGLGVFDKFREDFPNRFLNLGVAEQNMISFSAGLAMTGFKVFVYNIIPFVLYRCYEQVRNSVCYQKVPVTLVGIGSGVTYAPQGMTHYSIEDIGIARTLPNLTVISPIDPAEARLAAQYCLKSANPAYVRLAKRGEPTFHKDDSFDITLPQVLRDGSGVAILFHGSISTEVFEAYDELNKTGLYPRLISVPMLQPLNEQTLLERLNDIKTVITVEEHYENSGLCNIMTSIHSRYSPRWNLKTMGIPFGFLHEIKDTQGMRRHLGISAFDIVRSVKTAYGD